LGRRIERRAGEGWRRVARAVQPENVKGVGEPVEAQAPRDRDDVAAVDESASKPAFALDVLVEVDARGVLEQARSELVLRFLYCLAVDVVDLVADRIIAPALGRAGERVVVALDIERRERGTKCWWVDTCRLLGDDQGWGRRIHVSLIHHHPARIREHGLPALVFSRRTHIDSAAFLV